MHCFLNLFHCQINEIELNWIECTLWLSIIIRTIVRCRVITWDRYWSKCFVHQNNIWQTLCIPGWNILNADNFYPMQALQNRLIWHLQWFVMLACGSLFTYCQEYWGHALQEYERYRAMVWNDVSSSVSQFRQDCDYFQGELNTFICISYSWLLSTEQR